MQQDNQSDATLRNHHTLLFFTMIEIHIKQIIKWQCLSIQYLIHSYTQLRIRTLQIIHELPMLTTLTLTKWQAKRDGSSTDDVGRSKRSTSRTGIVMSNSYTAKRWFSIRNSDNVAETSFVQTTAHFEDPSKNDSLCHSAHAHFLTRLRSTNQAGADESWPNSSDASANQNKQHIIK